MKSDKSGGDKKLGEREPGGVGQGAEDKVADEVHVEETALPAGVPDASEDEEGEHGVRRFVVPHAVARGHSLRLFVQPSSEIDVEERTSREDHPSEHLGVDDEDRGEEEDGCLDGHRQRVVRTAEQDPDVVPTTNKREVLAETSKLTLSSGKRLWARRESPGPWWWRRGSS